MAQGGKTVQPRRTMMNCTNLFNYKGRVFHVSTINFIYRTVGWIIWCIGRSCRFNGNRVWAQTIDVIEEAGGSITALLATRDGDT